LKVKIIDRSRRRLLLLGPQPRYQTLSQAMQRLQPAAAVAVVTAGWEEDELASDRLQPLMQVLPEGSFNLELHRRSEQLFAEDVELIETLRERQDRLRHLRYVYCKRLDDLLDAARQTLAREDPLLDLTPERDQAIDMLRQLDRQYFVRTSQVCDACDGQLDIARRPAVAAHRRDLQDQLRQASALVISGGHAGIILNRLRIFGVLELRPQLPVVAWSAGAMALADQPVLFHDSPPQGRGNAEVLRAGMSLYDDFLPLPDAHHRLLLDDRLRVTLFCRRFRDFQCVLFSEDTLMDRCRGSWWVSPQTQKMAEDGRLVSVNSEVPA
jgi:hypothetical protein